MKKLKIILLCLFFLGGCAKYMPTPKNQARPEDKKALIECIRKRLECFKNHKTDSVYYDYSNQYAGEKSFNILNIYVDNTLYSPDSLFLFSFIVLKRKQSSILFPYEYIGFAQMGYRCKKDTSWMFYPIDICDGTGDTYIGAIKVLKFCYYKSLKNTYDQFGNSYKVNANNSAFWTESLLFTKVLDGKYYYFQCHPTTKLNVYKPYDYSMCD